MKILLADDSETIVDVLQFLLQSRGYEVVTAGDGIEAVVKTYYSQPDLVLLDIEMPKMNGYQVCRLLKHDAATQQIPIVMLTSRDQKRDRFWGLSTGADEYITKDFESEEELFATIRAVIEQSRNSEKEHAAPQSLLTASQSLLKDADINELTVLERVNHILDRQLFQTTLVNELSSLAINMHSFSTIITSVFSLLEKVCDFRAASIFLKMQHQYALFLYALSPIDQSFRQDLKDRVLQEYRTYHPAEQIAPLKETRLDNRSSAAPNGPQPQKLTSFFALPLKVRDHVIGLLALGHAHDTLCPAEVLDTLQVFTNEASLVLDNALLVNDLEQSNQQLEHTITELKNTQTQLIQSEKMASLGQLVAGVAHEINTPAGAINAASSNLIHFLPSIVKDFETLAAQGISPEDRTTFMTLLRQLFESARQKRKSTLSLRQETRELENQLEDKGFEEARKLAKQIARLDLNSAFPQLFQLFTRYDPVPLVEFLEKCNKIVNVSQDIKLSIDIITRIIHALKMYSRLDQAKVEEVDLHEGIETTLIILQNQMKHGIEVKRRYGELPIMPCYADELNQVWTNLIHNAVQAMHGNGTLTIETCLVPPQAHESPEHAAVNNQDISLEYRVSVKITDTGPGIPEHIQDKIFDPYFTTKDQGEGSGLGLGIVRQIVEHHHGEIRFTSHPGETSFEVLLPASGVQSDYLAQ